MSVWSGIRRVFPDIWKGYKFRKRVRGKHRQNLISLSQDDTVYLEFDREAVSYLGEVAETKHYEITELVKSVGYRKNESKYKIHRLEDREKIRNLTKSLIWRIRLKNGLSIIAWFILFLISTGFIAITSSFATSIASNGTLPAGNQSIFLIIFATSTGDIGFDELKLLI